MLRTIGLTAGGLALLAGALWTTFLVAMRTKFQPLLRPWRRMLRSRVNPRMLRDAGQPGAYASVIHHVGRTSGTAYATPVVAVPTDDGFAVALPYGTEVDWLRNVQAAGTAELEREGQRQSVDHPELVSGEAGNRHFPAKEQRTHRLFGTDEFLLLRRADSAIEAS